MPDKDDDGHRYGTEGGRVHDDLCGVVRIIIEFQGVHGRVDGCRDGAVNEEDDNLQNIEDEDTPLAAGGTAKDGIKTWWWWIAAAVAAITGKGVYDNRRRKPAKSDDSEDNSDEK